MKIAVSSSGNHLDSALDPRFGRAGTFIIYDTETGSHDVLDNAPNMGAAQGAGVQTGQQVVSAGVQALITGNCGPKAFAVLSGAGVKVHLHTGGTVKQAIDAFLAGKTQQAQGPSKQGHWA
jgi:predicted Fe-Mo cluster-binding NifX family protein